MKNYLLNGAPITAQEFIKSVAMLVAFMGENERKEIFFKLNQGIIVDGLQIIWG